MDDGKPWKSAVDHSSCLKFCASRASSLPCLTKSAASKSPPSLNTTSIALGKPSPLAIASVVGGMFGLSAFCQPGGVGIDTVRSGKLAGATGCPDTPLLSRYCEKGIGVPGGVGGVDVVVVQIDW